jgi:hypothetical protein
MKTIFYLCNQLTVGIFAYSGDEVIPFNFEDEAMEESFNFEDEAIAESLSP